MADLSGWWLSPTPLKNDGVKVSWDDDIPNMMGQIKVMFQTSNQLDTNPGIEWKLMEIIADRV